MKLNVNVRVDWTSFRLLLFDWCWRVLHVAATWAPSVLEAHLNPVCLNFAPTEASPELTCHSHNQLCNQRKCVFSRGKQTIAADYSLKLWKNPLHRVRRDVAGICLLFYGTNCISFLCCSWMRHKACLATRSCLVLKYAKRERAFLHAHKTDAIKLIV